MGFGGALEREPLADHRPQAPGDGLGEGGRTHEQDLEGVGINRLRREAETVESTSTSDRPEYLPRGLP
jgi:hypothetical protein